MLCELVHFILEFRAIQRANNDQIMTKIDFHILPTDQEIDVFHYVARLVQKALNRSHRVLIATEDNQQTNQVSEALWGFQPEAFLAHTLIDSGDFSLQITHTDTCGEHHDVLVNLRSDIPPYFSRFERVFELVSQHPARLNASRDRYRYYSDHGYALKRHDLRDRVAP